MMNRGVQQVSRLRLGGKRAANAVFMRPEYFGLLLTNVGLGAIPQRD